MNHVFSTETHHHCPTCGEWERKDYCPWWPIKVDLKYLFRKLPAGRSKKFISVHYWQSGWKDLGVRAFQRVIWIWRIVIVTGPKSVETGVEYVPEWSNWLPSDMAEKAREHIAYDKSKKQMEQFINALPWD